MKTLPLILAFFCVGFIFGYTLSDNRHRTQIKAISDTIVTIRVDTIRDTLKVPKYERIKEIDTVFLQSAIDSVFIPVQVPISEYIFQDSLYRVSTQGYKVKMNSIEVYPRTIYKEIATTTTVKKFDREKRFGIGVQLGYGFGFTDKTLSPYIGIGISYNLITF